VVYRPLLEGADIQWGFESTSNRTSPRRRSGTASGTVTCGFQQLAVGGGSFRLGRLT